MRRIPLLLLFAVLLAAASTAAAQTTPRRPPADTLRFGATRPAAGDSITMAEYDEDDADSDSSGAARASDDDEAEEDTVPRPRTGPYSRAGGTGPFSVQASGQTAARPPRGEVVWVGGRAARPAADSARRDTARAGSGQRVASGQSARRDTASTTANRPATRRDTASTPANRPATRRDTTATASRPAARDTAGARRNGQTASTPPNATTGGRTGSTSTTPSTSGRTGSTSTPSTSTSGRTGSNSGAPSSRARTHTVAAGETFYGIARRYGVTAAQLRATNPDVEMEQLEIGDVLRLPASARDSRAGASSTTQAPRTGSPSGSQRPGGSAQRRTHTVVAGETLFGIARRYGVTVDAIREANEMETDQVRTGQRLVIPPAR